MSEKTHSVSDYIRTGSYRTKRLTDKELEEYDEWFSDYKEQLEREQGRKLTKKEEDRLYKLLSGIQAYHGEYDERYHKYLLGRIINERSKKIRSVS